MALQSATHVQLRPHLTPTPPDSMQECDRAAMPPPPVPLRTHVPQTGGGSPISLPPSTGAPWATPRPPPPGDAGGQTTTSTAAPDANQPSQPRHIMLPSQPVKPAHVITTEDALHQWPQTPGYQGFVEWLRLRCTRIRGKPIVSEEKLYEGATAPIAALLRLLDAMISWIDEVPPLPQENQRFGNRAFKDYIAIVEDRLPSHLPRESMPPFLVEQLLPLLLQSHAFGHPTRLDYGTGHELAFVLGLWCCVVSGWVGDEAAQDDLILRVFPRYLDLTTRLQSVYKLEPAGSHGVWGLDDYCFLPYLFGSAQLLNSDVSPADALRQATTTNGPFEDLYTLSLHRISLFKHGAAFSEHSPMLDSLSTFPSWTKPHNGLMKMFKGEVLGKRVVVQGLWVGGWCWGNDLPPVDDREETKSPAPVSEGGVATAVPWKVEKLNEANRTWGAIPQRR